MIITIENKNIIVEKNSNKKILLALKNQLIILRFSARILHVSFEYYCGSYKRHVPFLQKML